VVYRFIPSEEQPLVQHWLISRFDIAPPRPVNEQWTGFGGRQPLTLVNGDVFEFSFACNTFNEPAMKRDYVIRARGRYGPDVGTHASAVPGQYQLYGNYPNPFNATTVIRYQLGASSHVRLDIYNVLGQHVTTLVEDTQDAGVYVVTWDGRDDTGSPAASGFYFARMVAGDFVQSREMILLK
jgi:hypothetical protein